MSLNLIEKHFLWASSLLVTACVAGTSHQHLITLNQRTEYIEGYLVIRGEWNIFPRRNVESYNPYTKLEDAKCVSLVGVDESTRKKYSRYDGNKVLVKGRAIDYENLKTGSAVSDRLLSKKYFNDEMVENSCLREYVFVVESMRAD